MGKNWTDFKGDKWPVVTSKHPLRFSVPSHAALRRHVYNRDGFACKNCHEKAVNVPSDYDGSVGLYIGNGRALWLDHIKSKTAGGLSVPDNLQTLCERCSGLKQGFANKAKRDHHRREMVAETMDELGPKLEAELLRLKKLGM